MDRWPLLQSGYAKRTTVNYKNAVIEFLDWCDAYELDPISYDELDDYLCDFIHELYHESDGKHDKQKAVNAVYGITVLLPRTKDHLVLSVRAVNRWGKTHPSVAYPPLTWDLAVTVAVQMVRAGHYEFAVATVLGFDCLLRVSELINLRRSDVADAKDARMGSEYRQMSLRIRKAKTGVEQSVDVRDRHVKGLLRAVVARTTKDNLLFPGGVNKYRKLFKCCCAELDLSPQLRAALVTARRCDTYVFDG